MDNFAIAAIVTFLLGLIFGKLAFAKKYVTAGAEVAELVSVSLKAIEDGKLTGDEVTSILKEAKDVKAALDALKHKAV